MSHPLLRAAPFTRSDIEALLTADECRILASLPADWLVVAAIERGAVADAVSAVARWRDQPAGAAWVAHRRRMHASALASARAARVACARLGVARLPG